MFPPALERSAGDRMTLQRKFVEGKARRKVFIAGGMAGYRTVHPRSLQGGLIT